MQIFIEIVTDQWKFLFVYLFFWIFRKGRFHNVESQKKWNLQVKSKTMRGSASSQFSIQDFNCGVLVQITFYLLLYFSLKNSKKCVEILVKYEPNYLSKLPPFVSHYYILILSRNCRNYLWNSPSFDISISRGKTVKIMDLRF